MYHMFVFIRKACDRSRGQEGVSMWGGATITRRIIITKRGRAASVVDKDGFALGKDTVGTVGCFKGQN